MTTHVIAHTPLTRPPAGAPLPCNPWVRLQNGLWGPGQDLEDAGGESRAPPWRPRRGWPVWQCLVTRLYAGPTSCRARRARLCCTGVQGTRRGHVSARQRRPTQKAGISLSVSASVAPKGISWSALAGTGKPGLGWSAPTPAAALTLERGWQAWIPLASPVLPPALPFSLGSFAAGLSSTH